MPCAVTTGYGIWMNKQLCCYDVGMSKFNLDTPV